MLLKVSGEVGRAIRCRDRHYAVDSGYIGQAGKATVTMTIIGSQTIVEYVKSLEARHAFSSISTGGGGERKNASVVLYAYYAKESGA